MAGEKLKQMFNPRSKDLKRRIMDKIALLRREGKSEDQAIAISFSMAKRGEL